MVSEITLSAETMATTSDSALAASPPDAQAAELHFLRKRNAELQSQVEKLLDSASNTNVGAGAPSCSTSLDGGVNDVRGKRSDEFLDQPSDFVRNLSLDGHSELGLHHRRTKSSNNSKKRSWSFSPNKLRGRRNNIESGLSEGFDNECNNTNATSPARKTMDRDSASGAASLKRYKPPRLNPLAIEQGDGEFTGIKPANDASSEESDHLINDDDDSYNKHMQSDLPWSGSQSSISAAFPPFKDQIKERAGWLIGLLFLQSCSSFIIQYNEQFLQNNMVLVQFLTMLVGAGGNAGNQAAVRVIRSLAVGTLNRRTMRFFLMQGKHHICNIKY